MKFRGPVVIVQDMLELLGSSTFKEDTAVISDKLEIDTALADIHEKYKELYNAILAADRCNQINGGIIGGTVGTVSSSLELIREQFVSLRDCYDSWERARTTRVKDDHANRYSAILTNIRSRTIGGPVGNNWGSGRWLNTTNPQGLNKTIENAKNHAEQFKPRFDEVVAIARQIDSMTGELNQKVNNLENKINSGQCNEELRAALTERTGSPAKSIIERYKDILKWNVEEMAGSFKNNGYHYIDNIMKPLLDGVIYRNMNNPSSTSLTRTELENIPASSWIALSARVSAANSWAAVFAGYTRANITYNVPPGFLRFAESGTNNREFFLELEQMMRQSNLPPVKLYDGQSDSNSGNAEEGQRSMIKDLLGLVTSAYKGLKNEPLGALHLNSDGGTDTDDMDMQNIVDIIPQALNEPVANVISDPLGSVTRAADYLLLLSYCTSAFSNYTTARPGANGKTRADISSINFPKSITGVPLSPEVNYFFQSEWEYLYNGDRSAAKNLNAVTRLIFTIRLICNYITVFSVSEVTNIITSIRTAFSWNPILSLVLGELARAAFVAAESAVDVSILRGGHKIPLIKSGKSNEWKCSPSGIAAALANVATDSATSSSGSNDKGLSYSNYLLFFFVSKGVVSSDPSADLIKRTADLIEWNVINYKNGVFSDEGKMAGALSDGSRFKLVDMKTDFSLTTTVDMRMLFLSMLFAQDFSNKRGIGMPATMPVVVTDHRGY